MMTGEGAGAGLPEALSLLTFTVMGIRMGVDTLQVDGMLTPDAARDLGLDFSPLHEVLPFRGGVADYASPRVLVVKGETPPWGILVEEPDDIAPFGLDSLRPLPPLVESRGPGGAVWGVAVRGEEMILLIDLAKISRPAGDCRAGGDKQI
jgi:hypothetical protein